MLFLFHLFKIKVCSNFYDVSRLKFSDFAFFVYQNEICIILSGIRTRDQKSIALSIVFLIIENSISCVEVLSAMHCVTRTCIRTRFLLTFSPFHQTWLSCTLNPFLGGFCYCLNFFWYCCINGVNEY